MGLSYSLQSAIKNLWGEKWINILTVLTIAVGFSILGIFMLITMNMDITIKKWARDFGLIVYLEDDITSKEKNMLRQYFSKDPDILEVRYISKDTALVELRQALGGTDTILKGIEDIPLPSSFELQLKPDALTPSNIRQKALEIKGLSGVEEVQYGERWLWSLNAVSTGAKIVGLFLGTAIFVAIIFTTYSTIKILFYRRVEEIETLKLLGATKGFIRLPFLIEGLFIGTLGSISGFIIVYSLYALTSVKLAGFLPSIKGAVTFFPPSTYPIFPIAGALMGLIGSFLAIGRIKY